MGMIFSRNFLVGAGAVALLVLVSRRGYLGTTIRDAATKLTAGEVVSGVGF
jgi:uncharacterized membrane protein YhiD involved in acid resistance